ncbi:MAG: hypothetical protein FJ363_00455 [Gemmatimonadetes bacterium]|nr:hypothetical protein [Gemmatimonadota bacterium]
MNRIPMQGLLATVLLVAACGGKSDSAATPAADSTAVAPAAVPDSTPAMDSAAKPTADSAAAPAAAKPAAPKQETGDYDKAIRPRFKVDEKTGKIDTIKRP